MEVISSCSIPKPASVLTVSKEKDADRRVVKAIHRDNRAAFIAQLNEILEITPSLKLFQVKDSDELGSRAIALKLLCTCCEFDAVECALALLNGEVNGVAPVVNEFNEDGLTALHVAAARNSAKCVEVLLRKRARTDLKSKDGLGLIPLELSLASTRMEVIWNPNDSSIEDLVVCLAEKDLTAVTLLTNATKNIAEIAFGNAINGSIVCLAALLIVAAETLNEVVLEVRGFDLASKEKMTIYEAITREALSLGHVTMLKRTAKWTSAPPETEIAEKRKLLLCEIELLQLFGAVSHHVYSDRKLISPLILAAQAEDEAVVELLLRTNIDVNDVDAEGSTALHWSLKTSKGSCPAQMKILLLLLRHGARVNHKNKLGLTAVHIAAANGNSKALQVLLSKDPEGINYKTELKETPLFFAVKNDNIDCMQILLLWGANTEVLNLRKQRPIDLAETEDMRFLLNPANFNLGKHILPIQHDKHVSLEENDVLEDITTHRVSSRTKKEICKYFQSPGGCARGTKCFYAHDKSEDQQMKLRKLLTEFFAAKRHNRKIFVGGLPPLLDSDSLHKIFEEQFGLVEDTVVVENQSSGAMKSGGFGFVTFKEEKSAMAAVEAKSVLVMGSRVEIRNSVPRILLLRELKNLATPEQEENDQDWWHSETSHGKHVKERKSGYISWVDRLFNSETHTCSAQAPTHVSSSSMNEKKPAWLRIFKKWFPGYLLHASKHLNNKEYPLSSLKADFRATCGVELDHTSLGYSKLGDFVKSLPDLCQVKIVPVGGYGTPSHMVLLPNLEQQAKQLAVPHAPLCATETGGKHNLGTSSSKVSQDDVSMACRDGGQGKKETEKDIAFHEVPGQTAVQSFTVNPNFLLFLKPDPVFHSLCSKQSDRTADNGGSEMRVKWKRLSHQGKHVALEGFAKSRHSTSLFFLREFDFYKSYMSSIAEGACFACGQQKLLLANFPCRHLLWCGECGRQAARGYETIGHKCVICDMQVEKTDFIVGNEYRCDFPTNLSNILDFPPLDPDILRCHSRNTQSPDKYFVCGKAKDSFVQLNSQDFDQ